MPAVRARGRDTTIWTVVIRTKIQRMSIVYSHGHALQAQRGKGGGAKYRISSIRRRHRILSGALSETPLSNSSRTKTSGVPAQPLVMQSNSQFLHWTLSPPKQGFLQLANFKLHVFSNSHPFFLFSDLSLLSTSYSVIHSLSPI